MRDNVNVPGTPLAETQYLTYGCLQGHSRNALAFTRDCVKKVKGFSIYGVWLDEVAGYCSDSRAATSGEDDNSQRKNSHLG
jgi:hypothetical protein